MLEDGDMLLEIDGTPIASCREVDVAIKVRVDGGERVLFCPYPQQNQLALP